MAQLFNCQVLTIEITLKHFKEISETLFPYNINIYTSCHTKGWCFSQFFHFEILKSNKLKATKLLNTELLLLLLPAHNRGRCREIR